MPPTGTRFERAAAVIWTPKRIVAAAGEIKNAGPAHFAMTGLTGCADTGFDAARLIGQALQAANSFSKRAQACMAALEEPLAAAAQFIHDHHPADFKRHLTGNTLEALLFAESEAEMVLSHIMFRAKRRGKNIVMQSHRQDYPNANTGIMSVEFISVGVGTPVLEDFFNNSTEQKALVYPEETLKKFMGLAIAAEHASYPIKIVKLAADGATHAIVEASR